MKQTDDSEALLNRLLGDTGAAGLPPVMDWNPAPSGDLDMRIAADGSWYYMGSRIQRERMVKLFSTILKREGDDYFLVTPVEKFRIQVDDAPFVAIHVNVMEEHDVCYLVFETNVGDRVVAGEQHPLVLRSNQSGQLLPYILIRHGLEALVNRNVYYELIDMASQRREAGEIICFVSSGGNEFVIGSFNQGDAP